MYSQIDFHGLDNILEASECRPIEMHKWVHNCGTYGCLIGNFCLENTTDELKCDDSGPYIIDNNNNYLNWEEAIAYRFQLSTKISSFCFRLNPLVNLCEYRGTCTDAVYLSDINAKERLKKVIQYLKRKRALWEDHNWLMSLSKVERHKIQHQPKSKQLVTA